jgi:hypothetical protein
MFTFQIIRERENMKNKNEREEKEQMLIDLG